MKIRIATPSITGEELYIVLEQESSGMWYNTVDDGFEPADTTIDGTFNPNVELTETDVGVSGIYEGEVTIPNGRYRPILFKYRGSGDYDHDLDTQYVLPIPYFNVRNQPSTPSGDDFEVASIENTVEEIALIDAEIDALDAVKLETTDVDSASIGQMVTNVIANEVPDGSNPVFTFAVPTIITGSEIVTVNGIQKIRTVDYMIDGNAVTFLPPSIPIGGDVVVINCCITATWA